MPIVSGYTLALYCDNSQYSEHKGKVMSVKEMRLTGLQQKIFREIVETGISKNRRVRVALQDKGYIRWNSWWQCFEPTETGYNAMGWKMEITQRE
jgi:hypothetical protein